MTGQGGGLSPARLACTAYRVGRRGRPRARLLRRRLASPRGQALALARSGRWYEAVLLAEQALAAAVRRHGPNHPDAGHAQWVLGAVLVDDRQPARAALHFAHALRIRRAALGDRHLLTGRSGASLGAARFALGDLAGAIAPLELAVAALGGRPEEAPRVARATWQLAQALWSECVDRRRARRLVEQVRAQTTAAGAAPDPALERSAREWLRSNRAARMPLDLQPAPRRAAPELRRRAAIAPVRLLRAA